MPQWISSSCPEPMVTAQKQISPQLNVSWEQCVTSQALDTPVIMHVDKVPDHRTRVMKSGNQDSLRQHQSTNNDKVTGISQQ